MLLRRYEMPWRRAYEAHASVTWALATLYGTVAGVAGWLPQPLALPLSMGCLGMSVLRLSQALRVLVLRASLGGQGMEVMSTGELARRCTDPDQVYLGMGFEWQPVHAQRLYELAKVDYRELVFDAPPWLMRLMGYRFQPQPDDEIGLPYIHGVEPQERPLRRPLRNFEGGTLLVGTTQAGKGVVLGHLITQAVRRGDVVIVIDPKSSKRLKRIVQRACEDYREPGTFLEFHPAFPERGVRLDFLFNWQKPSELASRIQSIMPPDTAGAFSAFGWDAVNVVIQGLVDLEVRPNLVKLTQYIEGGIEPVLEASMRRNYEQSLGPHWRDVPEMRKLLQDARHMKRPSEAASVELMGMVAYYEHQVAQNRRTKVLDAQVRTFRHNREHYQKITANLLPILSMLTSGDLGRTLSPDPFDADDTRPMMNLEKVERAGHVLYMNLDSLPDPSVASALGALALADLAARAGMRYNLGGHHRISLFVDEVSNVINQPLIEILNKGAEGGIYTTCAMQTLADLAKRLGSEAAARMAVGNLNNLIALRTKDQPTQEFVVETFGKTAIHSLRLGLSHGSDAHLGDFSSSHSVQLTESFEDAVPPDVLGKLPNLHYFASVSGGRRLKGRVAILDPDFDVQREAA